MTHTITPFSATPSQGAAVAGDSIQSSHLLRHALLGVVSIGCAILITACGGGGGGGTGSVTPGPIVVTPPPVITPDTAIVTSVPVATYMAGTGESAAFALINSERQRCGFGLLAQNAQLDVAAAAHAKYVATDYSGGHVEDATKPNFYGITIADRVARSGYSASYSSEDIAGTGHFISRVGDGQPTTQKAGGEYAIHRLLSAPYHLQGLVYGFRDVGIGVNGTAFVADFGVGKNTDYQKSDDVRSYPCDGTKDTLANTKGESPAPFPNEFDPLWGQPIVVTGAADLKVSSVSVTGPFGSVAIKAMYGNGGTTDPNGYFSIATRQFAIIPSATLTTNTTYTVTINGINKASPFTRTFSFTTGAYTGTGYYPTGQF